MEMGMGGPSDPTGPLSPKGVDFSNQTQAEDFLGDLLNDDELKVVGNAYARYFWYGVAVAVTIATISNLTRRLILRARLRAAAQRKDHPARPQSVWTRWMATMTAMARESTYLQYTPTSRLLWFKVPPMGTVILIILHFAFVLALEFANNDVAGAQFWQARGVRAGWLAVAQMPLLILLVSKNNIVGLLTGVSFERLNVLHRWTSRIMLFLAILHFGYQSYGWQHFGLMVLEWNTDSCPPTGIAAFALLLWLNISTFAPFRSWSYEFFVVQHLVTFFGFIVAVMYHLPSTALGSRIYIYIPIGLYLVDRLIRTTMSFIVNPVPHRATLTSLDGGVTKVKVPVKRIKTWSPGSYVLLSIPKFGWIESHPATIVSTPRSHNGDMVFMLKSQRGFTRRILNGANNSTTALLPHTKQESAAQQNLQSTSYRAFINGPYGGSQSDFAAFDSALLVAGSTGVTFILAILQDLADRSADKALVTRRVHVVWCVKSSNWAGWCNNEISSAVRKLSDSGIEVEVSIYVTCADAFTEQGAETKECGCECDKSLGPCCCVLVDEDDVGVEDKEDDIKPDPIPKTQQVGVISTKSSAALSTNTSSLASAKQTATRMPILPCAAFYSGRPTVRAILEELLDGADGESAVGVCGPVGLSSELRNTIVQLSDERAIHKGTGAQGCYLHVESFS